MHFKLKIDEFQADGVVLRPQLLLLLLLSVSVCNILLIVADAVYDF